MCIILVTAAADEFAKINYLYLIPYYAEKLPNIEPQWTGVNGSIYPRFEISHIGYIYLH